MAVVYLMSIVPLDYGILHDALSACLADDVGPAYRV
jgi:hypothetical protein